MITSRLPKVRQLGQQPHPMGEGADFEDSDGHLNTHGFSQLLVCVLDMDLGGDN